MIVVKSPILRKHRDHAKNNVKDDLLRSGIVDMRMERESLDMECSIASNMDHLMQQMVLDVSDSARRRVR